MTTETRISTAALLLIAIFACFVDAYQSYEIPQPKFKLLKPKGFQFSIPDESGIQLFAFHGNLNKKMEKMDRGQFSADTISKQNGKWIYENPKLKVRPGDVIYYWLFVIKNGVGYRLDDGIYEISDSEIYHTNKKIHKLRKRTAYNGHSFGIYVPSNFGYYHRHIPGPSAPSEYNDEPHFGHGYGHGYPHHHERDFPRGYLNNGHGHGHNQGHGYGHRHHWGHNHKHNHDCNWGEENNSEESTTSNESNLEENQSTDNSEINTGSGKVTTDTDAEMIETSTTTTTTTDVPPIDIRFGETN